jgi:homoaconitase/3-isopropylmalate dehydratase large subunit
LIENGDYVKSDENKDLKNVEYIDEILQNVAIVLNARRGKFYPNKDFGSYIKNIENEPKAEYALNYARQAVSSIDGVYVKSVDIDDKEMIFTMIVNEKEGLVRVKVGDDV